VGAPDNAFPGADGMKELHAGSWVAWPWV
jgi:hypothetical protein